MGLLLGASALTLCEVVDFFIYNTIRKTLSRQKETDNMAIMNMENATNNDTKKPGIVDNMKDGHRYQQMLSVYNCIIYNIEDEKTL